MSMYLISLALLIGCGPHGKDLRTLMMSAEDKGFSGSVLVIQTGDILHDEAYGEAIRGKEPFTTLTVSSLGSLTKQFTAAAVLAAEQDGLNVVTGDKINIHLDDVPERMDEVTIHHLLSHQSGLVDSIGDDEEKIGRKGWLTEVFDTDLDAEPGEKFGYSNVGYGVAAAIVEEASGQDYETYLRERLFEPIGMMHTGYEGPDWSEAVLAEGYHNKDEYGTPLGAKMGDDHWNVVGNGEILSTTGDMQLWLEALEDGSILSDASVERLWTEHVDQGGGDSYGYGWGIVDDKNWGRAIEHDGSNGYYFSHLVWWPDRELFVFYMCNDPKGWTPGFAWDISNAVLR